MAEPAPPATEPDYEIPEGIRRARAALRRDLPALLASWRTRGKWAAYTGDGRVGASRDHPALRARPPRNNAGPGMRVPLRPAAIWIHPDEPGHRDRLAERPPCRVGATRGIAVYTRDDGFPRLPILGLRAVAENELVPNVSGPRREATPRTAGRWWPSG